jgi:hypothetical protein
MHRPFLVCVALLAAQPAFAETVYKCVDAQGAVAYQGMPCKQGRTLATYAPASDAGIRGEEALEPSRIQWTKDAVDDYARLTAARFEYNAASGGRDAQRARCVDAKSHRDATLRVVGLSRDFELLRDLDDAVYEACKTL